MSTLLPCNRRSFLVWGLGVSFLLVLRQGLAAETAVVHLRIDGMT